MLFVRDGARVSAVELEPGAVVPSHHHDGPHLLVAVSDLQLRSDVEGQGPMAGTFKSGDVKWLPGGYTHTLTNTGKDRARFVTVELNSIELGFGYRTDRSSVDRARLLHRSGCVKRR